MNSGDKDVTARDGLGLSRPMDAAGGAAMVRANRAARPSPLPAPRRLPHQR